VIAMAHKLKLKVVAEGIETAAQLGFLRRQHCDIGQGYLFDRPIAAGELIARLQCYPCRS
jgi:EAL domain-containing protein (putative c-di-GMP-specific phosphodiesterase class I)